MRKGIGTTLGIIFFFAILFSAIVPLQLYVKQHKHLLIRTENEMEIEDNYRKLENLYVLGYPNSTTSDEIFVKVRNKGPIPIFVERGWIKDNSTFIGVWIDPSEEIVVGPYTVILEENTYYRIKVSTNRGNIFSSETGALLFLSGVWVTPTLGVSVQIANEIGKYYVNVTNLSDPDLSPEPYITLGQDQDDVLIFFDVKENGEYLVICKKNSETGPHLPGSPMVVEIDYPRTPPVAFMYTSGLDT